MKVSIVESKQQFKPVTVQLTFETQDELDRFGSLCNMGCLLDYSLVIWKQMEEAGADISKYCDDIRKILR